MNEPVTSANGGQRNSSATSRPRASVGRLVSITVCLLVVGGLGICWWTFGEGEKWWHKAWLPAKVEFRGKVTLNGEPLRGGQLLTWPDQRGVPRSVGFIDETGEFVLRTDIDGDFID